MICAIVLAAGKSRRMGVQKLMLPIAGHPVIVRIVDAVAACPSIADIIVVTGSGGAPLREVLSGANRTRFVDNPDPDGDMLSSVRCGVRTVPHACTGVLVVLGDQPGLTPRLIADLLAASRDYPAAIIVPSDGARRGHPLLFPAAYCAEVLTNFDGIGLRGLLAAHPETVREVPIGSSDPCILADIDTPEDYDRIRRRLE